ncbi:purine nucleoside phosphorylase I, inosine and guanosine-specific [delta proteobacterium NaphS2]|nr:purine nucleoside phosphorylase I, inosine and guanosine-specific [delta proteobacterium NaphS2]
MLREIKETANFISSLIKESPEIGMITGTGLGMLTEKISADFRIPFEKIPNFPTSTVKGHQGNLIGGTVAGKYVLALEGRFHLYEGYSPKAVTFPVRVMAMLGVKYLFMSSAAGGLNPHFDTGDLMVITDHINLKGTNPLVGPNLDDFGPRFPDMSRAYDSELIELAHLTALEQKIHLRAGVYVGVLGPSLETPAETRFLKMIGADAVGMSTVSQAIVGVHSGLKILGIVVITNINLPDCMEETSLDAVIAAARKAGPTLSNLWEKIIDRLNLSKRKKACHMEDVK